MSVREIFTAALQVSDPVARGEFLDRACAADAALRARVETLLAEHDKLGSFLEAPCGASPTVEQSPPERPGMPIGPYKLLQQIGEGGMGAVYMAEQTRPVERRVALKIIKPGMDTRQVIARFEAERQALALMDHPHIAKVLDAGATDAGRPYFVMELVKGVPITKYCDEQRLGLRERLELFLPVCQAIQHAHQKGIIHRDVKPSNVLVALYDGRPVPKVIDFGVAKATAQKLTEKTMFTEFGQVIGTFEYMSPEQAELNQLDIDTRTDIYSLGVLLYELLTGATPLDAKRLRTVAFDEMLRMIREEEPAKPSTRLNNSRTLGYVAANRNIEPARLSKLVRGELDWIVMKALEKDRSRRYETADGLALDLQRYLDDQPVGACPPSALYRFRKFARRNKATMMTTLAIALALVAGTIVSISQAIRARQAESLAASRLATEKQARREAVNERDLAQRRLFDSRLAEARASRLSSRPGRRSESWRALREAAALAKDLNLGDELLEQVRDEAIASLALPELRFLREWKGHPPGTADAPVFDARLELHASSDTQGNITIRRVADGLELARLLGEGTNGFGLTFSPDQAWLAVRYENSDLTKPAFKVWDWRQRAVVFEASGTSRIAGAFSPDGKLLATAMADGSLRLLGLPGFQEVQRMKLGIAATHVAFQPQGRQLAVSSWQNGEVQIRDVQTGELIQQLAHSEGRPYATAWHPQGDYLAVGCKDAIRLWEVATAKCVAVFTGHQGAVVRVAFAQRGNLLVSGSYDNTVRLWQFATGQQLFRMPAAWYAIGQTDNRLACILGENVRLFEIDPGPEWREPLRRRVSASGIAASCLSPDGRHLIVNVSEGTSVWDLDAECESAFIPKAMLHGAAFHPAGKEFFTGDLQGLFRWPAVHVADALRVGPPQRIPGISCGGEIAADAQGRFLAVGSDPPLLLNLDKGDAKVTSFDHARGICVSLSPDGRWLATSTHNGLGVKVWEIASRECVANLIPEAGTAGVEFSPNGRWLATITGSKATVWETGSWRPRIYVARDASGGDVRNAVTFGPGGTVMAVVASAGKIHLISPNTGQTLARLETPAADGLSLLTFTRDGGRLIVSVGTRGEMRIWDLQRVSQRLADLGLEWEAPFLSAPIRSGPVTPLRVEVDLGDRAEARTRTRARCDLPLLQPCGNRV